MIANRRRPTTATPATAIPAIPATPKVFLPFFFDLVILLFFFELPLPELDSSVCSEAAAEAEAVGMVNQFAADCMI